MGQMHLWGPRHLVIGQLDQGSVDTSNKIEVKKECKHVSDEPGDMDTPTSF